MLTESDILADSRRSQLPEYRSFAPYTRARVRRQFKATVDDEISVDIGEEVFALYREDDWLYVLRKVGTENERQGFVPAVYVDMCKYQDKDANDQKINQQVKYGPLKHSRSLAADKTQTKQEAHKQSAAGAKMHNSRLADRNIKSKSLVSFFSKNWYSKMSLKKQQSVDEVKNAISKDGQRRNSLESSDNYCQNSQQGNHRGDKKLPDNVLEFLKSLEKVQADKAAAAQRSSQNNSTEPYSRNRSQTITNPLDLRNSQVLAQQKLNELDACSEYYRREPCGRYVCVFEFRAHFSDDLTIRVGDIMTCLNGEDAEWLFVRRGFEEGFVPANYVVPVSYEKRLTPAQFSQSKRCELIVTEDFRPDLAEGDLGQLGRHDLSALKGDFVYTKRALFESDNKSCWLWVYAPKLRRWGFLPYDILRQPMATNL